MRYIIKSAIINSSAAALAVVGALWMMRESVPVEFTGIYFAGVSDPNITNPDQPKALAAESVEPGKTAVFRMVGEKLRNCPAVVAEEIVDSDGDVFRLPARVGGITETGPFDTLIEVPIDPKASPGRATFRQRASYGMDILNFCFRPYIVGPPQRPAVKFCIGTEPCQRWRRP